MIRGEITRRTSDGSNAAAAMEIIAPVTTGVWLREMSIYLAAATASLYKIGRPAVKGITPTTPVTVLPDSGTAGDVHTTTALAWGTGPTVPAQFFRAVAFPATISSSVVWLFSSIVEGRTVNGLWIPAGASLVLWNSAANGVVDVNIVVDEPNG